MPPSARLALLPFTAAPGAAAPSEPNCAMAPCAGEFSLEPGFTQLAALLNFELHGNIASLGDAWQHPGLTRLVLLDSEAGIPLPEPRAGSLPALGEAYIGHSSLRMPPLKPGLFSEVLRNVTSLVSLRRPCMHGRAGGACSRC